MKSMKLASLLKSQINLRRHFSKDTKISQICSCLLYETHGDPEKVLDLVQTTLSKCSKTDVVVKMLAASINPADINQIQGVYPVKPQLPAVGGNEGVGEVISVGSEVTNLNVGDRVIPALAGWGTWRTHAICPADDLIKISKDLPLISAVTLSVNPSTAYRMLKDFVELDEGDVVVQNAANSAVGQAVIQIAANLKLRTINIVRNRPNLDKLVSHLNNLGATHVFTDETLKSPEVKEVLKDLPKPKLGFNAVGGKSVADILKIMEYGSSLVTYGGMSKQPLMVPTGSFIFNNIKLFGFWMSKWNEENKGSQEQKDMLQYITDLFLTGKFQPPKHEALSFSEYKMAIHNSMQPYCGKKQLLIIDDKSFTKKIASL